MAKKSDRMHLVTPNFLSNLFKGCGGTPVLKTFGGYWKCGSVLVSEKRRSPNQSTDNKLRLMLVYIWFTNTRGRIISFKENVLIGIIFFPLQLDYPSQRQQLFSQAIGKITSGIINLHIICVNLESISSWHGLQNTKKHLFWLNKTDASDWLNGGSSLLYQLRSLKQRKKKN